jgi:uncharacterized membrane protein YgcG
VKRVVGWLVGVGFFAVVTAGLWLPPIVQRATVRDYHFPEVRIDARVLANGDLVLEETRTFDFRNGPFTYAYFDVDDPLDRVRDFEIVEVLGDGAERPVEPDWATHSIVTNGFQARWSYVAEDESRTWRFRYRIACAVDVYEDTAHLYWQFIGVGWDKPTEHAVVTVHLPGRFSATLERPASCDPDSGDPLPMGELDPTPLDREDVRAFGHGPLNGDVAFADPQTIRYEVLDVPPLSYVEGSILFPVDVVPLAVASPGEQLPAILEQERAWAGEANALRSRHDTERRWVGYLLVGVPVVLALFVVMARLRDRVPDVPEILEQPPEDDPVGAALLWSAWQGFLAPQNAYRAQLLRLARLGAIELRAEGRVSDPKDLTIARRMDALDLPTAADQDFLWLLFGRGDDAVDEVAVGRTRPMRTGGYGRYTKWLEATKERSRGLVRRIQKGDARIESTGSALVAIAVAGYGVWTAVWGLGGAIGWWLVPVSALSLIVALRIIPARLSPEDRTRVMRLAAFRRYLRRFSDLPNAPALAVIIWEHYLEWAVALDVAREVERQVKTFVPVESLRSPLPGGPSGPAGINAWHSFQAAVPTMVLHSMASASRAGSTSGGFGSISSSSGFSSGGFSGGGGGGGGGTGGGAG